MTGRGWHGEPARHGLAARGIATKNRNVPGASERDVEAVKMASKMMWKIVQKINRFNVPDDTEELEDWIATWQMSVREQDKMTRDLDYIVNLLDQVELPTWMNEEIGDAREEISIAWSSKTDEKRMLHLELARERLHSVITNYLTGGKGMPGPPLAPVGGAYLG